MLLISDASSPLNSVKYANYAFLPLLYRLVGIPLDQVRSLRERTHVIRLNNNPDDGCYIKIGLSAESILQKAGLSVGRGPDSHKLLADEQILELAGMNTDIWKMKASAFELLFQHGFETADANLHRSNSKRYPHMSWSVDPV